MPKCCSSARLALFERLLIVRLTYLDAAPRGRALVQRAVAEIAQRRGALSIRALSEEIGVSHKRLITQFQRLVGTTPKALARLYRVQRVLDSFERTPSLSWAQLAHHVGYFDEAHLDKDFRAFTGHTPTAYRRVLRRARVERPELTLPPKYLPAG
jgi:AraC-like DNA-binding protein